MVVMPPRYSRFEGLNYEEFRMLACDSRLSDNEKIGFPDELREGFEEAIFSDLTAKLSNLKIPYSRILDIGAGRGRLLNMLLLSAQELGQQVTIIDSPEMLSGTDDFDFLTKLPGKFPNMQGIGDLKGLQDVVICYSVFQYILPEASATNFLDVALSLLAPGGQFLIGDLPNQSMKKRFLATPSGVKFHREYMETDSSPVLTPFLSEPEKCDDSVILFLVSRARALGFHAYILPQAINLPFSNRREDVLIVRP